MSTQHEAHLVVGAVTSDIHLKEGEDLSDVLCGIQERLGYIWYQEDDIIGMPVHECVNMNLSTPLQRRDLGDKISKALFEIEKELSCQAVLTTCVYTY